MIDVLQSDFHTELVIIFILRTHKHTKNDALTFECY